MKILTIRLKNINSLKGTHEINLNNGIIADTGLFAITGATGSGKSTILDAITLALYNKTPRSERISKESINQDGSVMTRGTKDSFAECEFSVNNKVYLSSWSIAVNRNDNLNDYKMSLSLKNGDGEFEPISQGNKDTQQKNIEITGLTYDQFIKSILLSQGEFAKFLKARADERSQLLEKITGTDIYRLIGIAAFDRLRNENHKLDILTEKKGGITVLSKEEVESVLNEKSKNSSELSKLRSEISKLNNLIKVKKLLKDIEIEILRNNSQLKEIESKHKSLEPQKIRLTKHKSLLPKKSDIELLFYKEKELKDIITKLDESKKYIDLINEKIKQFEKEKGESESILKTISTEKLNTSKKIVEVNELDSDIKNLNKLIANSQEEINKDFSDKSKIDSELENEKINLNKYQKLQLEISEFIEKNTILNDLDLKIIRWESEFNSIKEVLISIKNERYSDNINSILINKTGWNDKKEIINNILDNINSEINNIKSNLVIDNPERLDSELIKIREQEKVINRAGEISKQFLLLKQKEEEYKNSITQNISKEKELAENLEVKKKSLEIFQLKEAEYKAKHQRELLEKSFDQNRANLKENDPCPLCGSKDHPYVKEYYSSVDKTEEELKKTISQVNSLKDDINKCEVQIASIKSESKNIQSQIKNTDVEIKNLKNNFEKLLTIYDFEIPISESEKILALIQNHADKIKNLENNQTLIKKLHEQDKQASQVKVLIDKVSQVAQKQSSLLKEIEPFNKYLNNTNQIKDILPLLKDINTDFKEKKEKASQLKLSIEKSSTLVSEKANLLKSVNSKLSVKNKSLIAEKDRLKKMQEKRFTIFGNKVTSEVEKEIELSFTKAQENLNSKKIALVKTSETLTSEVKNRDENIKISNQLNSEVSNIREKLTIELNKLGVDSVEIAHKSILPEAEAEKTDAEINKLNEDNIKIKQSLKELNIKKDETLKINDNRTLESVENLLNDLTKHQETLNQTQGALTQKLNDDAKKKENLKDLIAEISKQEKEQQRWKRLNELIGDAKGNKYSKFAQELTLNQMLSIANKHLVKLNNRYFVKYINNGKIDDLFVVDTLQGDMERSVRTLSGGESFLISLALALGLSDLAGQNTKIESLFIDEGFGTLDQETLDVALSTLERLQIESNRTIGIISHVDALKERITTQISLTKDNSGYSTMEITG